MSENTVLIAPEKVIADALDNLDITQAHSDACHAETRYWLENAGLDDPELVDLSTLPFITIDNPDSRDLDQALLIERDGDGYRVRYALADAAFYIRPDSALFREALARGTTYYTPLLAAPMLPVELSEGLVSLNPLVDRRALVFDMQVNNDGNVSRTTIIRAKIRSKAKLNYAGVQAWLDTEPSCENEYDESLLLLRELGNTLIEASDLRGVVKFDRTETHIHISGVPSRFHLDVRRRYDTERYNEQISLMCNMQGAEMLLVLQGQSDVLQAIYRVHDAPLKKSLNTLRQTLEQFSQLQEEPALWQWTKGESLSDYVDQLPDSERYTRKVRSIQRQIMQAQRGSTYEPEASEHHALKAASYARFSSPMREIVGIFTHKELLEALGGAAEHNTIDEKLRDDVIDAATMARTKQRQLDKVIQLAALHEQFSQEISTAQYSEYTGTIMGLRQDRLYISLDDNAVDVKIYKDHLDELFATQYEISTVQALPDTKEKPQFHLGDSVKVQLSSYDMERSRYLFTLSHL